MKKGRVLDFYVGGVHVVCGVRDAGEVVSAVLGGSTRDEVRSTKGAELMDGGSGGDGGARQGQLTLDMVCGGGEDVVRKDRYVRLEWVARKFGVKVAAVRVWLSGLRPRSGGRGRSGSVYSLRDIEGFLRVRTDEAATGVAQGEWEEFDSRRGQVWVTLARAMKLTGAGYNDVHRVLRQLRARGGVRYCVPLGRMHKGGTYYYWAEDVAKYEGAELIGKGGEV